MARGRGPARAHDDAGALVGNVFVLDAGIADRLLHGDVVPGRAAAEEAHGAAVDRVRPDRASAALHLAAEAELGEFLGAADAGFGLAQAGEDFLRVVADG